MTQDFSYMSHMLAGEFEAERARLIYEHIQSLPPEKRAVAYEFQQRIDRARMLMEPQEFLVWMAQQANELAQNMSDALVNAQAALMGPPPIKPASER